MNILRGKSNRKDVEHMVEELSWPDQISNTKLYNVKYFDQGPMTAAFSIPEGGKVNDMPVLAMGLLPDSQIPPGQWQYSNIFSTIEDKYDKRHQFITATDPYYTGGGLSPKNCISTGNTYKCKNWTWNPDIGTFKHETNQDELVSGNFGDTGNLEATQHKEFCYSPDDGFYQKHGIDAEDTQCMWTSPAKLLECVEAGEGDPDFVKYCPINTASPLPLNQDPGYLNFMASNCGGKWSSACNTFFSDISSSNKDQVKAFNNLYTTSKERSKIGSSYWKDLLGPLCKKDPTLCANVYSDTCSKLWPEYFTNNPAMADVCACNLDKKFYFGLNDKTKPFQVDQTGCYPVCFSTNPSSKCTSKVCALGIADASYINRTGSVSYPSSCKEMWFQEVDPKGGFDLSTKKALMQVKNYNDITTGGCHTLTNGKAYKIDCQSGIATESFNEPRDGSKSSKNKKNINKYSKEDTSGSFLSVLIIIFVIVLIFIAIYTSSKFTN